MRGKKATKRKIQPEVKYNSVLAAKFINNMMRSGKKTVSRGIFLGALEIVGKELNQEPYEIFEKAIQNCMPQMEVRSKRIGGANYQIPIPVEIDRSQALAMKWIISFARQRKGKDMVNKLALEIIDASNKTGGAIKKMEDTHKAAEANKAFSHYR